MFFPCDRAGSREGVRVIYAICIHNIRCYCSNGLPGTTFMPLHIGPHVHLHWRSHSCPRFYSALFVFVPMRQKLRIGPLAHLHGDLHFFFFLFAEHPVFFFLMGTYTSSSSMRKLCLERQKLRWGPRAHLHDPLHLSRVLWAHLEGIRVGEGFIL